MNSLLESSHSPWRDIPQTYLLCALLLHSPILIIWSNTYRRQCTQPSFTHSLIHSSTTLCDLRLRLLPSRLETCMRPTTLPRELRAWFWAELSLVRLVTHCWKHTASLSLLALGGVTLGPGPRIQYMCSTGFARMFGHTCGCVTRV